jgi:hypothetical protein
MQVEIDTDDLSYYHGEWHISGEFERLLDRNDHYKIKIIVEVNDSAVEESLSVTYKELFKRATDKDLNALGVNIYYLNEGGDPNITVNVPKHIALNFMSEEEFEVRS